MLCKPLKLNEANHTFYIIEVIQGAGHYNIGLIQIARSEIGYVVDLPDDIQRGLNMTLAMPTYSECIANTTDIHFQHIGFGVTKERKD